MLKPRYKTISIALQEALRAHRRLPPDRSRFVGAVGGLFAFMLALPVHAVGLGEVGLQSALGEPLRATVSLFGDGAAEKVRTCFSARLLTTDGVAIATPRVNVGSSGGGASLSLSTPNPIREPALTLVVEIGCGDAIRKEFSLLLDPPLYATSSVAAVNQLPEQRSERQRPDRVRAQNASTAPTSTTQDAIQQDREQARSGARPATPKRGRVRARPAVKPAGDANTPARPSKAPVAVAVTPAADKAPAKNVLRLSGRNSSDADLVNTLGLRLALAEVLSNQAAGTPGSGTPETDPAKAAAARAAQARFAAILRGETPADPVVQQTEQKLQQLQIKMQALEAEAVRLRQAAQRDAAAMKAAQQAQNEGLGGNLLLVLGGLLLLSLLAVAWLAMRLRTIKHDDRDWHRDISTAQGDAVLADPYAARPAGQPLPDPLFGVSPGHGTATWTAASPAGAAAATASQAPASQAASYAGSLPPAVTIVAPMDFMSNAPVAPAAGRPIVPDDHQPAAPVPPLEAAVITKELDDLQFNEIHMPKQAPVEEISDVVQEAEFWLSLHDTQRAIEVLEPYATADQPGSPLPWLYLFDLYSSVGQEKKYVILHERFGRIFNGRIPTWEDQKMPLIALPERGVEDVAHVCDKIVALWRSDDIIAYLESLLLDDRDGSRLGFDLSIYREIMFLIGLAYEVKQSGNGTSKPILGASGLTLAA
jgi:pilus assembly protein FimV